MGSTDPFQGRQTFNRGQNEQNEMTPKFTPVFTEYYTGARATRMNVCVERTQ